MIAFLKEHIRAIVICLALSVFAANVHKIVKDYKKAHPQTEYDIPSDGVNLFYPVVGDKICGYIFIRPNGHFVDLQDSGWCQGGQKTEVGLDGLYHTVCRNWGGNGSSHIFDLKIKDTQIYMLDKTSCNETDLFLKESDCVFSLGKPSKRETK